MYTGDYTALYMYPLQYNGKGKQIKVKHYDIDVSCFFIARTYAKVGKLRGLVVPNSIHC